MCTRPTAPSSSLDPGSPYPPHTFPSEAEPRPAAPPVCGSPPVARSSPASGAAGDARAHPADRGQGDPQAALPLPRRPAGHLLSQLCRSTQLARHAGAVTPAGRACRSLAARGMPPTHPLLLPGIFFDARRTTASAEGAAACMQRCGRGSGGLARGPAATAGPVVCRPQPSTTKRLPSLFSISIPETCQAKRAGATAPSAGRQCPSHSLSPVPVSVSSPSPVSVFS